MTNFKQGDRVKTKVDDCDPYYEKFGTVETIRYSSISEGPFFISKIEVHIDGEDKADRVGFRTNELELVQVDDEAPGRTASEVAAAAEILDLNGTQTIQLVTFLIGLGIEIK